MNTIQAKKLNKYQAILQLLNNNQDSWQSLPALQKAVEDFGNLISQSQVPVPRGNKGKPRKAKNNDNELAQLKADRKKTLSRRATVVAGAVFVYAQDKNDDSLKSLMKHTQFNLLNFNDKKSLNTCKQIYEASQKVLGDLGNYGIGEAEMSALKAALDEYETVATKRKLKAPAEEKPAKIGVGTVNKLFSEMDDLLQNRIDKLMVRYADSHSDFHAAYEKARTQQSRTRKANKIKTTPTPATDGAPKGKRGRPKKVEA
jgi:hypothetical protein